MTVASNPLNPLDDWQELRGKGVQASLNGATLRLGSFSWLRESGVDFTSAADFANKWTTQGATILGVASDTQLLGVIALRDTLKPQANEVVAQLQQQGKATYLISGDNSLTAAAIAQLVGIPKENVFAEIRP